MLADLKLPDMPDDWHELLDELSVKLKKSKLEILMDCLQLYRRITIEKPRRCRHKKADRTAKEKAFAKLSGQHAKNWWDSLTPEQYEEERAKRRRAARKRWGKSDESTQG